MASKRQRGDGSGSSSAPTKFDNRRFVSAEAQERYNRMATQSLVPERGLRSDHTKDGELVVMIAERSWFTFTEQPDPTVIAVVKEFYANVSEHFHYGAYVRGKTVEIGEDEINGYYQFPTAGQRNAYASFVSQGPDYELIIRELCQPGTTWTLHESGSMTFPHSRLSLYGKAWYAYICAKLMPCTHVSDVTKERAVLLYSIVKGMKMDVGLIIQQSILRAARGGTTRGLPHPSLICALCTKFGVRWKSDEMIQPPMPMLDHKMIRRYRVWTGDANHPRGLGFIITQAETQQALATTISGSSSVVRRGVVPDVVQREIDGWFYNIESQNVRLAERQDAIYGFVVDYFTTQTNMYVRLHPTVDPSQFPTAPVLPVFPPSDQEMSDNEEVAPDE